MCCLFGSGLFSLVSLRSCFLVKFEVKFEVEFEVEFEFEFKFEV